MKNYFTKTKVHRWLSVVKTVGLFAFLAVMGMQSANAQFQGSYGVSNWTLSNANGNGYINTSNIPNSIVLTGSNNNSNSTGFTFYTITIPST